MAEQTVDSLVVKLGLDTSLFDKGRKDVDESLDGAKEKADRTGRDIEDSGKRAASFFGQIEKAAIKFFAVLTVGRGLADFTRTVVSSGAELSRVSQRIGTSADVLSRWQGAVRQSGGTAEGFLGTVQGLSNSLTELRLTGNTGILPYVQQLGVALADTDHKARPIEDIITDLGNAVRTNIPKGDQFNFFKLLGFDDGTANLEMKAKDEIDRLMASQKAYSDADAKAAQEAQEHWEGVKLNIERTTQALVIKALPIIERVTNALLAFADKAVPVIMQVADKFGELDTATQGWSTTLIGVLATLRLITGAGILGGLGALKGGIAGLATAGAGYAGYKVGEQINKKFVEGTPAEPVIGRAVAGVLAFFGNKEAQDALDSETANSTGEDRERAKAAGGKDPSRNGYRVVKSPEEQGIKPIVRDRIGEPGAAGMPGEPGKNYTLPPSDNISRLPSRAERNNNPGNLEFRGQRGAEPETGSGRFAKFSSAADGVAALVGQLRRYGAQGRDTLTKIIEKYAPANENNTKAYIEALSKKLGVGADQTLDLNNSDTLAGLVKGISKHESGTDFLQDGDILSGLKMAGIGSQQQSSQAPISIGEVKVYTQATDAKGVARDFKGEMVRQADQAQR